MKGGNKRRIISDRVLKGRSEATSTNIQFSILRLGGTWLGFTVKITLNL